MKSSRFGGCIYARKSAAAGTAAVFRLLSKGISKDISLKVTGGVRGICYNGVTGANMSDQGAKELKCITAIPRM